KKMKQNKNIFSIVAVLMILTCAISMFATAGIAIAQTNEKPTFPFVDAIPKTVGVGQKTLINYGLLNFLFADGDGWNVTVQITTPSGKTETLRGMTWSTGTVGEYYTPTELGTYTLQCIYEGEYYNSTSASYSGWYAASKSDIVELIVQEKPVPEHPGFGTPDSYWTRPVDSQLREWWSLMGSWVTKPLNLFAPYNDAPESAHILWSMPIGDTPGGLAGGNSWEIAYQNGDAYEGKFAGSIIIAGVLYFNKYVNNSPTQAIVAVDLHTGKTLWERSYDFGGRRISTGQTLVWLSLNNRGAWSYIWMTSGTNMFALDPSTGDLKYNMTNVPSGTIYHGPNGEMLKYQLVNYGTTESPNWHLLQWNSSWVVTNGKTGTAESWGSQIQGVSYNATERGYDLNVSISKVLTGSILTVFPSNRVIVGRVTTDDVILSAINLTPGREGQILFENVRWAAPAVWKEVTVVGSIGQAGWGAFSADDLVAIYWTKENRVNYAFSLENGAYMWQTEPQNYADAWTDTATASFGPERVIVYGKLIQASVGGIVYCNDIRTGELLWTYEAKDKYMESYITANWWLIPLFVSDNKVYLGHMEHSAMEPKPRGAPFFALDVNTGKLVWEIDGAFRQTRWGGRAIIGDGIIATLDTYDNQIYAIGKGPSAMTLTAPNVAVAVKSSVVLKGTVMDVSPGTQDDKLQLRFPNGVPAVSDASMSEWMLYVYKQFPQPMTTTGVDIRIDAVDPNGNYVTLGHTTSDASGAFTFEFKPATEGQYTIYAVFDGSASYYGTSAQDTLVVSAATETTNTPYELYIIGMGIVAIIVNLVVVLFFVRKK
ncbi:MAG: PQQ-binding-like beta-propeller repeat protein, partial [Candidatus Bathyarchaeota archaeon]|nr:PQQ-binding-like beta-propeller repeat protein [Candidatus Termiticorpusculum sp.]